MSVGKDKTGVLVNMDKELKSKLEQLAKKDGRSLTNLINKILSDYDTLIDIFIANKDAMSSEEIIAYLKQYEQ